MLLGPIKFFDEIIHSFKIFVNFASTFVTYILDLVALEDHVTTKTIIYPMPECLLAGC